MEEIFEFMSDALPSDNAKQTMAREIVKKKFANGFAPATILDLGCGRGDSIELFREISDNFDWVGVDIENSPEVKQRTREDVRFMTYDGVNLPLKDEECELIYSVQVLEHVRHPEKLLRECRRVMDKNGLFIGQTSNLEPYHSYSLWGFTPYGFKVICEDAGFQLIEIRPCIDSITLIQRSYSQKFHEYNKWFGLESPLNQKIDKNLKLKSNTARINLKKLIYCGHFSFVLKSI